MEKRSPYFKNFSTLVRKLLKIWVYKHLNPRFRRFLKTSNPAKSMGIVRVLIRVSSHWVEWLEADVLEGMDLLSLKERQRLDNEAGRKCVSSEQVD